MPRKGVATILRKVRAIKGVRGCYLAYFNGSWFVRSGLTLGDIRDLADTVEAKPVQATARPKKAGRVGRSKK